MRSSRSFRTVTACWLPTSTSDYLNDLLARHKSGLEDATDRIWRLLNLQIWGDIFITGKVGHAGYGDHAGHGGDGGKEGAVPASL